MGIKFNPLSGKFDLVNDANFSYTFVGDGDFVEIPDGQEMLFSKDLLVEGEFFVSGDTMQIIDSQIASSVESLPFFWTLIASNESITVPVNRLLIYVENLMVEGLLFIEGDLQGVSNGNWF